MAVGPVRVRESRAGKIGTVASPLRVSCKRCWEFFGEEPSPMGEQTVLASERWQPVGPRVT